MSRVHSGPAVGDHCLLSNGSWSGMECSLVSTSTDGGDYFGPIRRNFELSEPPGGCAPGLAADPLDLASGVLYFSNPASRTARERMVVRRSTGQQGLTWTNDSDSVLVYGGPAAYSCLAPLYPVSASNSHRVGLLYERDAPGCTGPSCAIYYTAIPTPNPKKKATKKTDDDDDGIDGSQAAAQTIPLDQLVYNRGDANATNRSLADVLRERVSVKDFGAVGKCGSPDAAPTHPLEASCPDETAAFLAAFAWASEPYNQITVHVPPGSYRVDGTIHVVASELVLESGAVLRRVNLTTNTGPIVRLGYHGRLSGAGQLTSDNPSPRGVVNIGPHDLSTYENVEYAHVSGVSIQGPGTSWSIMKPPNQTVDTRIEGSRGLCFDSSEGYGRTHMCKFVPTLPGCINHTVGGGACYQNSARDVTVSDIDVGVYMGAEVNGNQVSNIMMIGIGQTAYFLDGPNSENTIAGGFIAGFGGNLTVIKGRSSAYNYFMSVQSEPGRNSTYFDFDEHSLWNTVIGQDGTFDQSYECPTVQPGGTAAQCAGPTTRDPRFIYMQHGQLHIGDFNTTLPGKASPPRLDWRYQLQVEGRGYIRSLTHGFPVTQRGSTAEELEVVVDEPVLLISANDDNGNSNNTVRISNLGLSVVAHNPRGRLVAGASYEISFSGAGLGGPDCQELCIISEKFTIVPISRACDGPAELHVKRVGDAAGSSGSGDDLVSLVGGRKTWRGGQIRFALARAEEREVFVEVRRSGRPCTEPRVELVSDDEAGSGGDGPLKLDDEQVNGEVKTRRAAPASPAVTGPAVTVWNASFSTCNAHAHDNVDAPARAFTDSAGTVHVTASCRTSRLMSGPSLYSAKHNCPVVFNSSNESSPAMFADNEWIHSTYSLGGDHIFGLLHNECKCLFVLLCVFSGIRLRLANGSVPASDHRFSHGNCAMSPEKRNGHCQMFSLTSAVSTSGGRSWMHLRQPPGHLVAAAPHRYVNDSSSLWFGWGDSAGIVRSPTDGFYYTTGHNRASIGGQANGTCLMRTADLLDPSSWRAWNGSAFSVRFADPYTLDNDDDAAAHICHVLEDELEGLPRARPPAGVCCQGKPLVAQSLVWSTHFRKFLIVLWNTAHDPSICDGTPFVFALSHDLLRWTAVAPLPLPNDLPNGNLAYPSLLDPATASQSFDVIGKTPSLYFGLANPKGTGMRDHWDALVRVPLRFEGGRSFKSDDVPAVSSAEACPNVMKRRATSPSRSMI